MTDPRTGFVYLTEDEGPDGFYRFLPNNPGDLRQGGSLWMLALDGVPQYETGASQTVGLKLPTSWVRIENPDPEDAEDNASAVFEEGWNKAAQASLVLNALGSPTAAFTSRQQTAATLSADRFGVSRRAGCTTASLNLCSSRATKTSSMVLTT